MVKKKKQEKKSKDVPKRDKPERTDRTAIMITLPYMKGVSDSLQRVCRKFGVSTALKPHLTLKRLLVHPKDKREKQDKAGVVYNIPCSDCSNVYVGESGGEYMEPGKKNTIQR